ncbi:MAG: alcohol dehydrogenase catalytic domain-containing protein [Phycisphaerae bacterium]|nr:alcohol dehydrogenase catalytic domain-containing protein [Phycisphaerae bacterium]
MKAIRLTGIKQTELVDLPAPTIRHPHHVLLKLEKVGVCGSDVHYYATGRIGSQIVQYPFIVGHECSAVVVETGRDVRNLKPGQLVAVDPAMVCHECDQCRQGRENTCRKLRFLGCPGQSEGCLCEYIVMPADCLFPVANPVTADRAALAEPLSIGVYAVKQSRLPDAADVAVLGSGPIGLSVLLAAKADRAANVFVTDKIDSRGSVAKNAGATWAGNPDRLDAVKTILDQRPAGMDVVYECAGEQDTLDQAVDLLKPGGRLMLIGIPRVERVSFTIDRLRRKELTVTNVRRQNGCVHPAIDLIASGQIDVDFMVTHRFPLEKTQQAFDLVHDYRDGVVKAMIDF